jgi:hypothetical protein
VFVTMNRIPVRPEYREAFEEAFRQRARLVDRAPGFLRNLVLRPKNPEDPYIVLTFWESEAAFFGLDGKPRLPPGTRQTHPPQGGLPGAQPAGKLYGGPGLRGGLSTPP